MSRDMASDNMSFQNISSQRKDRRSLILEPLQEKEEKAYWNKRNNPPTSTEYDTYGKDSEWNDEASILEDKC